MFGWFHKTESESKSEKVKVVGVIKLQFVCLTRFTKVKVEEMKEKNLGCALLFCPTTPPSYTASVKVVC